MASQDEVIINLESKLQQERERNTTLTNQLEQARTQLGEARRVCQVVMTVAGLPVETQRLARQIAQSR